MPAEGRIVEVDVAGLRRATQAMLDYVRDMEEAREDWSQVCDGHPLLDEGDLVRGLEDAEWRLAHYDEGVGLVVEDPTEEADALVVLLTDGGLWQATIQPPGLGAPLTLRPTPP